VRKACRLYHVGIQSSDRRKDIRVNVLPQQSLGETPPDLGNFQTMR
jgi:hypothetical protein